MEKYSTHHFHSLPALKDTTSDSPKSSLIKIIGTAGSYGGEYGSMCGKPHVVFVPEARWSEDTDAGVGSIQHLLLGLYGLLAVLSLARLFIPSLSTSHTAFQVLQGDPAAPAAGRKRRDLALDKGGWKPVESTQAIPDNLDRSDHGHGDPDIDSYGAPMAPAVSVAYQGHHKHKTTLAHTGYQPHISGNDCARPVVLVMPPANRRTNSGLAGALLAGIPALLGALATGAPTYIFNRND
jgi:hypothetical protein